MCELFEELDLETKLLLVIHSKELKRTTNTGRLALKVLKNSEMRVRGEMDNQLDLNEDISRDKYQSLFLFPDDSAHLLTPDYIKQFKKPIQLIVPDGNWRQASKVSTRHKELAEIPKVRLMDRSLSHQFMRKESKQEGMATMQAIAYAYKVLESDVVGDKLLGIYNEKLKRTLDLRGAL